MTPGEIGRDLRSKGFVPEFVDDEPRTYAGNYSFTPGAGDPRTYIEDYEA